MIPDIVEVLIGIFQNKKERKKRRDEALGLITIFVIQR
jgi:hypothetical protein